MNATLTRHRLRSFLTILSTAIGAGSIIAVLGIGMVLSDAITGSLNAFGDPGIFVSGDPDQSDPQSAQLRYGDAAALRDANPTLLRAVFPTFQRTYHIMTSLSDTIASVMSVDGDEAGAEHEGRFISAKDIASARRVCVLSASSAHRLFGDTNPLEAFVRINGTRFLVIGVLHAHEASVFNGMGPSEYAEIPYSIFPALTPGPIDLLRVIPRSGAQQARIRASILATLHRLHGKHATYTIEDAHGMILTFEKALGIITVAVAAIDAGALLIAGVGIMNVMLVTITERTREIGIRKTIGADENAIFAQFLTEAVIISSIGCGIGMVCGCTVTVIAHALIVKLLGPAPIPWAKLITLSLAFSLLTGIVFGTYPALRARALEPMQALRM
jgi:putative ABC transport system permease protein